MRPHKTLAVLLLLLSCLAPAGAETPSAPPVTVTLVRWPYT